MRGRGELLVHIYSGAAAGVVGVLQGLQEGASVARPCRRINASPVMGVLRVGFGNNGRAKLSRLMSGSVGEGAGVDVDAFDGCHATGGVKPEVYIIR